MSWEQPAEISHIWVSGNKTPHIGKQISNCQNKCKFEFTVMCAFLGPKMAPRPARRGVGALPECEYSLPVAHGRLCVLASSQSACLHWLHKHTGKASSLGFVGTGFQGWERLMWNISLADGARSRFFFYLSLHTWLLVLWQRWEASLLLQITNFQCEYRFPGLTHQGFGELCERHAAVASPGGTVPSVSRKDVKLLSPPAMGLAPNPPYPTFTSLFSQGNAFLFVVNSSQGKASYKN